MIWLRNDKLC